MHRHIAGVGELMEHSPWDIHSLSRAYCPALLSKTHFPSSIQDKVDLFLLLVMPWHLAATGL
jgi:hypothetical protein